jgi:hypothetical protein
MHTVTRIASLLLAGSVFTLVSCSTGGDHSPSGFLSNYKQLDAGYGTDNAVSVYVKSGVDLKKYDSVLLDPVVTIVADPKVGAPVKDQLASYVSDSLRKHAAGDFKIVTTPGPKTLRVRAALTDVVEGGNAGTPVTTVHKNPRATLKGPLGPEAAGFVAKLSFEGEIVDSVTGERLAASTDQRLGAKRDVTATTTWKDVWSGVNQSANRLYGRFLNVRGH